MIRATLVRTDILAKVNGDDGITLPQAETLFQGDLAGAIVAARAVPADRRGGLRIETEDYFYGPELFDTMTADGVPLVDLDIGDGLSVVRLEKGALELLRGDRRLMPTASVLIEHEEVIKAILRHKKTMQDVEDLGDTRLIRITAADIETA